MVFMVGGLGRAFLANTGCLVTDLEEAARLEDSFTTVSVVTEKLSVNPFTPKLIMQILPTIQEEND